MYIGTKIIITLVFSKIATICEIGEVSKLPKIVKILIIFGSEPSKSVNINN
jgi:hypothetical protein